VLRAVLPIVERSGAAAAAAA